MKTFLKISIWFLALMSAITSCKKENPAPYPESDYFPLSIGNKWNYKYNSQEVTKLKTINNKEYYEILITQYQADTVYSNSYIYYRKTTDNKVYQLYGDLKTESLAYDFRVPLHNSWSDLEWTVTYVNDIKKVTINNHVIGNCKQFDYDIVTAMDDEHTVILAPGLGRLIGYSYAWGLGDTLKSAVINGMDISLR
jgi:hypothetical protein